jgi:S-adenosylmethionine:tRNA ribosyltransferase-isomerase
MKAAPGPSRRPRLLLVDPARCFTRLGSLDQVLEPGDVVVVNDAATLPASLSGTDGEGHPLELRLTGPPELGWTIAFGSGDWRTDTDLRPPPPLLEVGSRVILGSLGATVVERSSLSSRHVRVAFDLGGPALWQALYAVGEPVRYRYLDRPWDLRHFQNVYAARPWAAEMPSAGRAIDHRMLLALQRAGVAVHTLTHAAGLSATGDPALDRLLPLPEVYEVPAETLAAAESARRVIAIGTSVVRALESAARGPLAGITDLRVGPGFVPRLVDGIVSNLHGPGESHFELLSAFAPAPILEAAWKDADQAGLHEHEFGDMMLVLPDVLAEAKNAA